MFADEEKNALSLTNGIQNNLKKTQFQEQLNFNDNYDCYSLYQKHQYGLFCPHPKTSSVCFAPYKTTVLNRIHEICIGSGKRKILSSRICRNVISLRQILTEDI